MTDSRGPRGSVAAISRVDGEVVRVTFYNPDNGHTVNDYDRGVFNGETGHLVAIDGRGGGCTVDFGDRRVDYPAGALYHLDHAYAFTVHRAQGSEWPVVAVALTEDDAPLLQRAVLYTALTRARRGCVLVGERSAFARAVASGEGTRRYTGLMAFLRRSAESAGRREEGGVQAPRA